MLLGLPTPIPIPTLAGVPRVKGALCGSRLRPEQSGTVVAERPYKSHRTLQEKLPGADIDTNGNGRCSRALSDSLSQSGQEEETCVGADSEHDPVPHQYFASTPTLAVWDTKLPLKFMHTKVVFELNVVCKTYLRHSFRNHRGLKSLKLHYY